MNEVKLVRETTYADGRVEEMVLGEHNPVNPAEVTVEDKIYRFVSKDWASCQPCAFKGLSSCEGMLCTPNKRPDNREGYWVKK